MNHPTASFSSESDERPGFEAVIAQISATFVNAPAEALDDRIERALRELVLALGLDRSTLMQSSPQDGDLLITHSWAREGIEAVTLVTADPDFPWSSERMRRGEELVFSCLEELPPGAAVDRSSFQRIGPRSMAAFPLMASGVVVGSVTFGTLTRENRWAADVLQRLRLVAGVFAGALERKRSELRLREALAQVERLKERLEAENAALREDVEELTGPDEIVGVSPALMRVLHQVHQVAATDTTVLLSGETGTGKELIARAIHRRSRRSDRNLVVVNCAALPASLIESELFGHERGSFTGAMARKIGRFELADGGSIFLDEIGELTPDLQGKLLRVLQEREFERLGSTQTRTTDVRVLAATNRDLEADVAAGGFRSDLYYRLRVFPIQLPPLRDRPEDIPLLVWHLVGRLRSKLGNRIRQVPDGVMERLVAHSWPGNVRELQNVIEHAMIVSAGPELELEHSFAGAEWTAAPAEHVDMRPLSEVEREHIVGVLERCDWRVQGRGNAAERLGLNPSTLRSRMRKLEIGRPPARSGAARTPH